MAIIFQCPNCGSNIQDKGDDILRCDRCGTTITKQINPTKNVNINLKSEQIIQNIAAYERERRKKTEAVIELVFIVVYVMFFIWLCLLKVQ